MKFGIGALGKKLLLKCEFRDSWLYNCHTVHKDIQRFYTCTYHHFPLIWIKFGAGDLQLMPLSIEIWYTVSHTLLMGVNESLHFLSMYFYLFWNTCGIRDVHKNLLSNGQLRESWHSVSYTFFNETNVFLFVMSIFIFQFSQNLVLYTHTHIMLLSIGRFCENQYRKGITFLI